MTGYVELLCNSDTSEPRGEEVMSDPVIKAIPQHVNKKCNCSEKRVKRTTDGICYYFSCLECGTPFADLIVGAEP